MTLSVLLLCTGNVCRSSTAELLARRRTTAPDVAVASAGVQALVGYGVDPPTGAVLREWGVDPSGHRARQFVPPMAAWADLVLVAELRRTFTLREFGRLAPRDGGAPADVVARAAAARALHDPVAPSDDDVPDPFRGGEFRAREVAGLIAVTVRVA